MRSPIRFTRLALSTAAGFFVGGVLACGALPLPDACAGIQCSPCPPAVTVKVVDSGGGPVADVTLQGEAGGCQAETDATFCTLHRSEPGQYAFDVSAPGYKTQSVTAAVAFDEGTGCCACGYVPETVEVRLEAE